MTCPAMRHCLVLAGVRLTSPELMALERAFRSPTRPETITWQDLCRTAIRLNTGRCTKRYNASDEVSRAVFISFCGSWTACHTVYPAKETSGGVQHSCRATSGLGLEP